MDAYKQYILYVAITRTREILRLSRCVEQFVGMLGYTAVPPVQTAPILPAEVLEKRRCQDEVRWSLFHVRLQDEEGRLEDEEGKFHMILTLLQNAFPGSTRKAANLSIRSARSKTACR